MFMGRFRIDSITIQYDNELTQYAWSVFIVDIESHWVRLELVIRD